MKDEKRLLPKGWIKPVVVMTAAALAGNFLAAVIPWPGGMTFAYQAEAGTAAAGERGIHFLCTTLLLAPAVEEGVFRVLVFGGLRRFLHFLPAAVVSSLAFGLYHGNWIQGLYAFFTGMILAWGYERSEYHKFAMAVVMHGAANLAALAVFGW